MVIQNTIDNLRDRPHHERRAVALGISLGVVAVLFLGWIVFFVRNVQRDALAQPPVNEIASQMNNTYNDSYNDFSANAAAAASIPDPSAKVIQLSESPGMVLIQ